VQRSSLLINTGNRIKRSWARYPIAVSNRLRHLKDELFILWGKVYIPLQRITHSDQVKVIKDMPLDSDTKITKLKNMAIARCMERIDQAASKAKELMNKPKNEGKENISSNSDKSARITSFLKKRHGL